jgi:hypothetical protein
MFLLIDFINPQGTRAFTSKLDKIKNNVDLIEQLKVSVEQQKQTRKEAFSSITVFGRWLVVYQANVSDDEDTIMHFIDFRIDLTNDGLGGIFSEKTLQNLIALQTRYDSVYKDKMDKVELTLAEPFETVVKSNLFACDDDDIVISKAKELGVFPMLENLVGNDKVKITIADEKQTVDNEIITNIYALMHFGGHGEERKHDNGFAYIKIYDLLNNFDKINDFQNAIETAGGKFDRAFFMERFDKHKLN